MTSLISAHSLSKSFGAQVLFEDISFTLRSGDRVGLIGPNGAGKTSLLKILAGQEAPDSGSLSVKQGLRIGYASQFPIFADEPLESLLVRQIPDVDPVEAETRARILLGKAEFSDFTQNASTLSGGWKKRLDIVRAMIQEPDFLFLDEPTNHLDLEGILWLETFLKRTHVPYLIISHDRYFLENICNRMFELNSRYPDGILICEGNMSAYMKQKEEFINTLEKKERELSYKVREESAWLKTTPKARTTKSKSRILSAYRMMDELSGVQQKNKVETVGIDFTASERSTRKLLTAKNIGKTLGGKQLFRHVDLTLSPGTRLGIVGKNGTGKTTLLKILSGEISQDVGTVKRAEDLKVVYFDQHREEIPDSITLKEALCPYGDTVKYRGKEIHVNGWARRFLFPTEKLNLPVGFLSGGERARILIAKLMLKPADVLFLDEPTNDLDIPTLEVIEESLLSFSGAVVLISHDRCLMDRICTQVLGLKEDAEHEFLAGYDQWEARSSSSTKSQKKEQSAPPPKSKGKLSYKEKKELETMESSIQKAEQAIEHLQDQLKGDEGNVEHYQKLSNAMSELESLYERWQDLLDKSR